MKKILLCCGFGASTSLVASNMVNALDDSEKKDFSIDAISYVQYAQVFREYDLIMIAPQIRYKMKEIQSYAEPEGIPVALIDSRDYAMADGVKIMKQAKEVLNKEKK